MGFLDQFLSTLKYVAGEKPTIADYCTMASIFTLDMFEYDFSKFKNLTRWYEVCKKSLPGIEEIEMMNKEMTQFVGNLKL